MTSDGVSGCLMSRAGCLSSIPGTHRRRFLWWQDEPSNAQTFPCPELRVPATGPVRLGPGSQCREGHADWLKAWGWGSPGSPRLPPSLPTNRALGAAANLWPEAGGQGGCSQQVALVPSLPTLPPAAGLTSGSVSGGSGASRIHRKGSYPFGGGGYRHMTTAKYPLRAMNLEILSKQTLPVVG